MHPRFNTLLAVVAMLALTSTSASAKAFRGLIERRAADSKKVTSSKVINVQLANHKNKGKKHNPGEKKAKNRPAHGNSVRAKKILTVKKSEAKKGDSK